ncbi:MAG: sugar transferase [Desulfosoma sp.]
MLKKHHRFFSTVFRLFDLFLIALSYGFAYQLVYGISVYPGHVDAIPHLYAPAVNSLLWIVLSKQYGLYTSKRLTHLVMELRDVIRIVFMCLAPAAIMVALIEQSPPAHRFLGMVLAAQLCLFLAFRISLRKTLSYLRARGFNYRQVLIVGSNGRARSVIRELEGSKAFGIRILGFIDGLKGKPRPATSLQVPYLGSLEDLPRILTEHVVDEVFVTLPIKSFYEEIDGIIKTCETVGVEVKLSTNLFNVRCSKSAICTHYDIPSIDFYTSPRDPLQLFIKRLIDIVVSLSMLLIWSPILCLVALAIKLDSRGPILFRQVRVGYNGRFFTMYKFRTMVENAEQLKQELMDLNELTGPVFKIRNDPRVTRVGRFLRKTSIDELPQLINVLKGEMSLVGPRPPIPSEVSQYNLEDRRRLSMRPGITGIWQVSGRNAVSFDQWMAMDKEYIDNWSLWLDLKLLIKTIPAVLTGEGAA